MQSEVKAAILSFSSVLCLCYTVFVHQRQLCGWQICITDMSFSSGGLSLSQTYLSMGFSVLDYVFSINCNLCLLYFVRKYKSNQDTSMPKLFLFSFFFFFATYECVLGVNRLNQSTHTPGKRGKSPNPFLQGTLG